MTKASKLLRIYTDESAFFGDPRVFEFISDTNTPKNVLIVGSRGGGRDPEALKKIADAKAMFGIGRHYLEGATGIE